MSRAYLTSLWNTNTSLEVAEAKLREFLNQNNMKVKFEKTGDRVEIIATQGSQVTARLLGVWFVNQSAFPKRANIRLSSIEDGVQVEATIEETLGIGKFDSVSKNRYEEYFRQWMNDLMMLFPPPTHPSQDALTLFERAWEKWNGTDENERDNALKRDIASLFALAIKKAGAPFPNAHSWLAIFLEDLGDEEDAFYHANVALQHNPNDFRAQMIRVDHSLKGVRIRKLGVADFIAGGKGIEGTIIGSTFKGLFSVGEAAFAALTQAGLKSELSKLAKIFRANCETNTDVDEFLYMSRMMITFGDLIKDASIKEKPNLYAEVANSPIEKIEIQGREQEVMEIRQQAEGRSMLFRP